jgi:hypothetical protein
VAPVAIPGERVGAAAGGVTVGVIAIARRRPCVTLARRSITVDEYT